MRSVAIQCVNMTVTFEILISAARDVVITCKMKLVSTSQVSADIFVKLSDVKESSKGVKRHLRRLLNSRIECCGKCSVLQKRGSPLVTVTMHYV